MIIDKIHPKDNLQIKASKLLSDISALKCLIELYEMLIDDTKANLKDNNQLKNSIIAYLQDDLEDKIQQLKSLNKVKVDLVLNNKKTHYYKALTL